MDNDVFHRYASYYDLLNRGKNYAAEVEYVAQKLQAARPDSRRILELGAGTGRHGRLLANCGFDILGVERSAAMVSLARNGTGVPADKSVGRFDCVQGDIRTADLGQTFDAVLSLFHVVSYQTANEDLRRTFANAARHLGPGGVFLFDVWHGPAVLKERPAVRVKYAEDETVRVWRIAEPALDSQQSVVTVRYTILAESKKEAHLVTFPEEHRMRYLFPTEIELLADGAGFKVEWTEEFLTGNAPSESTWGVAYLLRRRA